MSELWKLSASEIADAVRCGKLSAEEVTKAHLERLDAVNPAVNAVVQELPDEAMAAARAVDEQVARGEDPGPLCGVPVTTKVTVDQVGQATTNGLKLQRDLIAKTDNPVVSNIRKAGGVIVGRTSTPAFSIRWFTRSDLYGLTRNPHDRSLTPGGSSGGASAAVASGICAVGHGTDIGGSIRYPAYACGLHGLRPTFGRIAAHNESVPERGFGAQLMAVSGPIARSIKDIEISLQAMAAEDTRDPWWVPAPLTGGEFPKRAALTLAPDGMAVAEEVRDALRDAAGRLQASGWEVEERPCPPMVPAATINAQLWMADMRHDAAESVEREGEPDSQFVFRQMTKRSPPTDAAELLDALKNRTTLTRKWQLFTQEYPILICPVSGDLPFQQQQDVESEEGFEAIMQAQLTQLACPALGLPGLAVATGSVGKTPVGVQLIGRRFREDILLSAGGDIESAGEPITPVDPDWL